MTHVLYMLLGAALLAGGVLAAALADRIRGIRLQRERSAVREMAHATPRAARASIEVVDAELVPPREPKQKTPSVEPKTKIMADDVIAALVAAGYKKLIASEAAWSCSQADRATVESWARAALRRAKGAAS